MTDLSTLRIFIECMKMQRLENCLVMQELAVFRDNFEKVESFLANTQDPILIIHCQDGVDPFFNSYQPMLEKIVAYFKEHPAAKLFYLSMYHHPVLEGIDNIMHCQFPEHHGYYYNLYRDVKIINQWLHKTFLCVNKRADLDRWIMYKKFYTDDLLKQSDFSFLMEYRRPDETLVAHDKLYAELEEKFNSLLKLPMPIAREFYSKLKTPPAPGYLELDDDYTWKLYSEGSFKFTNGIDPTWSLDGKYYQTSFCSVIVETYARCRQPNLSEKTFRAICHGHPLIIYGAPGCLQTLRDLGFDTYDDIFDNYYDNIDDPNVRFALVCDEIDRIANMSTPDLTKIRDSLYERRLKNAEQYKNLYYLMLDKEKTLIEKLKSHVQPQV